jgi:hypothetical protein
MYKEEEERYKRGKDPEDKQERRIEESKKL